MILRIRTNIGIWRVDVPSTAHVHDILSKIAETRPHVVYESPLSYDPKCEWPLDTSKTLSEQVGQQQQGGGMGLQNGSMIYCRVDASTCAENTVSGSGNAMMTDGNNGSSAMENNDTTAAAPAGGGITKRIIDKDGSIKLVHTSDVSSSGPSTAASTSERGFRKGLLPLRDMKMAWTLQEFTAMDDKYNFKIKRQESSFVGRGGLHLESSAVADFQNYLRKFQFQQQRFGHLYGRFVDLWMR